MKKIRVRKTIALTSMATLVFVLLYTLIMGIDIPESIYGILNIFTGYIGYYFGRSTALDNPRENYSIQKQKNTKYESYGIDEEIYVPKENNEDV